MKSGKQKQTTANIKSKKVAKPKRVSKKQLKAHSFEKDTETIYSIINSSNQNQKKMEEKRRKMELFMSKKIEIKEKKLEDLQIDNCIAAFSNI